MNFEDFSIMRFYLWKVVHTRGGADHLKGNTENQINYKHRSTRSMKENKQTKIVYVILIFG